MVVPQDGQTNIPNPGITIITVGSNSDRGWDQTRGWVLTVKNDRIDRSIVEVQSLSDVGLRVVHDAKRKRECVSEYGGWLNGKE